MAIPFTGQIGFEQVYEEIHDSTSVPSNYTLAELAEDAESNVCTIDGVAVNYSAPYAMNDFLGLACLPLAPLVDIVQFSCNLAFTLDGWDIAANRIYDFEIEVGLNSFSNIIYTTVITSSTPIMDKSFFPDASVFTDGDIVQVRTRNIVSGGASIWRSSSAIFVNYIDIVLPEIIVSNAGSDVTVTILDKSIGETRHRLERQIAGSNNWIFITNINSDETAGNSYGYIETITFISDYQYRVRAESTTCNSAYANSSIISI